MSMLAAAELDPGGWTAMLEDGSENTGRMQPILPWCLSGKNSVLVVCALHETLGDDRPRARGCLSFLLSVFDTEIVPIGYSLAMWSRIGPR
jgi:hypothetical protein